MTDRYKITIFNDEGREVIQGDGEGLVSLARAILSAVETKRTSSLLTMWGLLNIENTDALKNDGNI